MVNLLKLTSSYLEKERMGKVRGTLKEFGFWVGLKGQLVGPF